MKVLQYKYLPSQGINQYEEVTVEPDSFFPEGVYFETPDRCEFIRHIWARNLSLKIEVLVVSHTEKPPDQQKKAEIAAGAIAFLLKTKPPQQVFYVSQQQLFQNINEAN